MIEYDELLQRAEGVRDEVEPMENTAYRVGGVIVDAIKRTEESAGELKQAIEDASKNQGEEVIKLQKSIDNVSETIEALFSEISSLKLAVDELKKNGAFKQALA